jgi:hypothetical protein
VRLDVVLHAADVGRDKVHLHARVHREHVGERADGAAVGEVADEADPEVVEAPDLALNGVDVEQRLRRVLAGAVARVDDRD